MELNHTFAVPVDRATAWAAFEDISSVAGCFPGAVVTSVTDKGFTGTCKVKLGPVSLQYSGQGTFLERDAGAGRLVLEAKGRDKRGNGTAGANVTATFVEVSAGETRVDVVTDLQITGRPAQFGRGMIQDVSDKLLGQFVACLQSTVAVPAQPVAQPAARHPEETAPVNQPAAASSQPPPVSAPRGRDDTLDQASTVLPALLRSVWKPVTGALVAILVLRWLSRRR